MTEKSKHMLNRFLNEADGFTSSVIICRPNPTPQDAVEDFDDLTRQGFKLDLRDGFYHRTAEAAKDAAKT